MANVRSGATGFVGSLVAAVGLAALAGAAPAAELVTNGSFETGDFTGRSLTGNTCFTGVDGNAVPGDGIFAAFLGPVGSNGTLPQTLDTLPGRFYNINFEFLPY